MNKETIDLVNRLAEKLGTTAELLWGVLVKQATISAISNLVVCAAIVAMLGIWVRILVVKTNKPQPNDDFWRGLRGPLWAVTIAFGVPILMIGLLLARDAVTTLLNPEYWALKQILNVR